MSDETRFFVQTCYICEKLIITPDDKKSILTPRYIKNLLLSADDNKLEEIDCTICSPDCMIKYAEEWREEQ